MSAVKVAILGCGGFAREVLWALRHARAWPDFRRFEPVAFIDREPDAAGVHGLPVVTLDDASRDWPLVCGIGGMPEIKRRVVCDAESRGFRFAPAAVFEDVKIGPGVTIGEGTVVCAGNILTVDISVGRHVAVNLDCTIGHDAVVGDYSTFSPGAHVSGRTVFGEGAYLGTGCAVIEGVRVGAFAVVGAGAVVVKDAPDESLVVGVPAQVRKLPRDFACPVPGRAPAAAAG